jgi:hypothetical protein
LTNKPGVVEHGHYEDAWPGRDAEHHLHRLGSLHHGHLDVEDDHVGLYLPRQGDGVAPVVGLADYLYLSVDGEHLLEALAEHGVVVRQQDPYAAIIGH